MKPGATPFFGWEATPDDAGLLIALEQAAFGPRAWANGAIAHSLSARHVFVLLAGPTPAPGVPSGVATGFGVWRRIGEEGEILALGVAPDGRQKGLGRYILSRIEEDASARSLTRMVLDVDSENRPALALYRGAGYHEVARRKHYYKDGSDALVMARGLDSKRNARPT
ncbi:MAG: N-acetyltransferase [Pseudomonadota bacterium]